jgi:hypothetical protein
MTRFHTVLLTSGLALALGAVAAQAQPAAKPMMTLQMPALPAPVQVALKPATTALLMLDYVEPICSSQPKCKGGMLPAMIPFMAQVRKAGVVVAYGTRDTNMSKWLPEVAPVAGDIIMAGWKVSGSLAYTSVGATVRDYTVVIPMDTTTANTDYETTIGFYQILNQGNSNLNNEPLKPKSPTLSRTDLITFQ